MYSTQYSKCTGPERVAIATALFTVCSSGPPMSLPIFFGGRWGLRGRRGPRCATCRAGSQVRPPSVLRRRWISISPRSAALNFRASHHARAVPRAVTTAPGMR